MTKPPAMGQHFEPEVDQDQLIIPAQPSNTEQRTKLFDVISSVCKLTKTKGDQALFAKIKE